MDRQLAQPEPSRADVVRPLSRAAVRTCARPGCPSPASATLTFAYDAREVHLDDLAGEQHPDSYDLCAGHAERTTPPHGWTLQDERVGPDVHPAGRLDSERTVALIARALGRDTEGTTRATVPPLDPEGTAQQRLFGRDEHDAQDQARADAW